MSTCQYAKIFREINYCKKDSNDPLLTMEQFDQLIYDKYEIFIKESETNYTEMTKFELVSTIMQYLNQEFEGYLLFEAILDNNLIDFYTFFKKLYEFIEN